MSHAKARGMALAFGVALCSVTADAANLKVCPHAELDRRVRCLSQLLARSDGSTDDVLIASVLDALRSLGPRAMPATETLSALLQHRCKLYADRDKLLVIRLRAYIVVTLTDIGFPSSAMSALFDSLAHVDERMSPVEIGAAARAVRSLGSRGRAFAPYLLATLSVPVSGEEFSLERYDTDFPPHEATTAKLEVVRALGSVYTSEDAEALTVLAKVVDDRRGTFDPRVVGEARRALNRIRREAQ